MQNAHLIHPTKNKLMFETVGLSRYTLFRINLFGWKFTMVCHVKKLFLFSLIVCSQIVNANPSRLITNYTDLVNSVSQGDTVRAIMYVKKCSPSIPDDAIAGMTFTNFNKYQVTVGDQKKDTVATSITMMTIHGQLGPVYDYVRLRVFSDNSAEIFSDYLDPTSYKQLGSETMNCAISNGHDQNGILLYDISENK